MKRYRDNAGGTRGLWGYESLRALSSQQNRQHVEFVPTQWIKEGKNAVKWTRQSCRTMKAKAVRLQLHALAYNLADFLRTLVLPDEMECWSLTPLREKVVKIGAKVIAHARYTVFQMAEVAVQCDLFRRILGPDRWAQATRRGTMLTEAVEPDLRAFRQQKCVRAVAKPSRSRGKTAKAATLRPAEGKTPVAYSLARSMSLSCRQIKADLPSIWEIWV